MAPRDSSGGRVKKLLLSDLGPMNGSLGRVKSPQLYLLSQGRINGSGGRVGSFVLFFLLLLLYFLRPSLPSPYYKSLMPPMKCIRALFSFCLSSFFL